MGSKGCSAEASQDSGNYDCGPAATREGLLQGVDTCSIESNLPARDGELQALKPAGVAEHFHSLQADVRAGKLRVGPIL
jgi:hypothetical protein